MDIYSATQIALEEAIGSKENVAYIQLRYDEASDSFVLPEYPCVTWLYSNQTPIITQDGNTGLFRVQLDVEIWGELDEVALYEEMITEVLNAKRISIENVVFTLVIQNIQDIVDLAVEVKHRFIRFGGIVAVNEEEDESL